MKGFEENANKHAVVNHGRASAVGDHQLVLTRDQATWRMRGELCTVQECAMNGGGSLRGNRGITLVLRQYG